MAALRLFSVLFLATLATCQGSNPVVKVTSGILQGSWKESTNGRRYASFEGIPYARPPVGKYRFREPQQLKPWAGTWNATKPLSECLQYDSLEKTVLGSENCLYVNVHTPQLNSGANLPVVVFIHGGGFMFGSSSNYGADNFMDRDVVLVTFNYRVGPLGFLSSGDEQAPGNAGLKDQAFLLRWVQKNIMMFGGNPDSVTLTGNSAGSASVHYHTLSPLSKGTFARAIAYSGTAFGPWAHTVNPLQRAKVLAGIVGCPTTTTREMVDCLKDRPAEVIVSAQIEMFDWKRHAYYSIFTPTVEAPNVRDPFLSQYPYQAAQAGAMHDVPLITTITSEEGLYPAAGYLSDPNGLSELEARWEQLAPHIFVYNDTLPPSQRPHVAAKIKQKYFGNKPVSQETFPQLVQAFSDRLFDSGANQLAQVHALRSSQPVYVYRFSHRCAQSMASYLAQTEEYYGVSHADDLILMFTFPGNEVLDAEDKKMGKALIEMIYSFATTGVPTLTTSGEKWLPVTPGAAELNYLEISSPSKQVMKTSSDFGHKSFWDSLGFYENDKYQVHLKDEL